LRVALFAKRHPGALAGLGLDALAWACAEPPAREQQGEKLAEF